MLKSVILLTPITENKSIRICLVSLPVGDNGQFGLPLSLCQHIAYIFHIVLIMFPMLLACSGVFGHISGPKRLLPVKTIQATTSQIYFHKVREEDVKSLIPMQQRYPRHRESLIPRASVDENVTSGMLEAFGKELKAVAAGWDPESCRWLEQSWVPKSWRWLKGG